MKHTCCLGAVHTAWRNTNLSAQSMSKDPCEGVVCENVHLQIKAAMKGVMAREWRASVDCV